MKYYLIMAVSMLMVSSSHIIIKLGANLARQDASYFRGIFNRFSLFGYGLMVVSSFCSLYALTAIPLKDMVYILPSVYILVPLFSIIFLKEKLSTRGCLGFGIIILGIIVFNIR